MIPRYDVPEVSKIWSDENKYRIYLEVELALLETLEEHFPDKIPAGTAKITRDKSVVNPARVDEIEKETKHDVIAFCTSITENLTPEQGRFFHFGVTSSDIIDTSFILMLKESTELIIKDLESVIDAIYQQAKKHKDTLAMGRSHGIYAEPLSFGQKLLGHGFEFKRRLKEIKDFYDNDFTGQLSGAVGNYTILSKEVEKSALQKLGLKPEPLSTQVIPRDRIAKLISINSLIATAIERLAVEIRHLHRTEVGELFEGFSKGQKGSSTMPHKKNPISGENLTGIARTLRSHMALAMENCILWHERDISHSSAERMFLPDNTGLLVYGLRRLRSTVENLVIKKEVVEQRVEENFVYLSSYYLHQMILQLSVSREDCYVIVQQAAFNAKNGQEFYELIKEECKKRELPNLEINSPSKEELRKLYLSEVDSMFKDFEAF